MDNHGIMNIIIFYGTLEGQTAKIAERIAQVLRDRGLDITSRSVEDIPDDFELTSFEAAVIGGSIHMGKYPSRLPKIVMQHRDWLNNIPSAFFTVCMGINSQQEKSRQKAAGYSDTFIKETNWRPTLTATFAGAVKYTQYNFVTRFIMKMISRREGGSTDTSRDHEYTDWEAVTQFAEQFAARLNELQTA